MNVPKRVSLLILIASTLLAAAACTEPTVSPAEGQPDSDAKVIAEDPAPSEEGKETTSTPTQTAIPTTTPTPTLTATPTPPTVKEETPCWEGPGTEYALSINIAAGTEVDIIGVGEKDGWYIIANPEFDAAPCWIAASALDVDANIDLSDLEAYANPPTPTPTLAPTKPAAPSKFFGTLVCNPKDRSITFTWKDNSDDEIGFRFYKSSATKVYKYLPANTTAYKLLKYDSSSPMSFYLDAYNDYGHSAQAKIKIPKCEYPYWRSPGETAFAPALSILNALIGNALSISFR